MYIKPQKGTSIKKLSQAFKIELRVKIIVHVSEMIPSHLVLVISMMTSSVMTRDVIDEAVRESFDYYQVKL